MIISITTKAPLSLSHTYAFSHKPPARPLPNSYICSHATARMAERLLRRFP